MDIKRGLISNDLQNESLQLDQLFRYVNSIRVNNNEDQLQSAHTSDFNTYNLLQINRPSNSTSNSQDHLQPADIQFACTLLLEYSIINPEIVECYYFLGLAYELDKQFQNAQNQYQLCINLDPNHQEAYNSLGQIMIKLGQQDVALKSFQRQVQVNQKHVKSFFNIGNIYLSKNQLEDAIFNFTMCLSLEALDEDIYITLANIFERQQESEKQIDILQKQLGLFPKSTLKITYQIGQLNYKIKNYKESIKKFEYCSSFNPHDSLLRYKIAVNYENLGENDEAIKHFLECLKLDSSMWVCYFHLGFLYKKTQNAEGSKKMFQNGLNHNPDHVSGLFELGLILMKEKDYQNALIFLEKSLLLCDLQQDIYSALGRIYFKLNMLEYSFSCIKVSQDLLPNDRNLKLMILKILLKQEKFIRLIKMSTNMTFISKKDCSKFTYIMGEAYYRLNKWEMAIKYFLDYFQQGGKNKIVLQIIKRDFWKLIQSNKQSIIIQQLLVYIEQCSDLLDDAHILISQAYLHKNLDFENAKKHLNEVLDQNQVRFQLCMTKYELFGLDDIELAKKRLLLISQKYTCECDAEYKLLLAELHLKQMNYTEITQIISTISPDNEFQQDITYLQGMSFLKQKHIAKAIAKFKRNQNHDQSSYQLGIISRDAKDFAHARSYLFKSIRNSPDNPQYLKTIIDMEIGLKRNNTIIPILEVYTNLMKNDSSMLTTLSRAQLELKQYKKAEINVKKSIELDQSQFEAFEILGELQIELGFFKEAFINLTKSIQLNGDNFDCLFMLGKCHFHFNEYEQTSKYLEKCLQMKPSHVDSLNILGQTYLKMERFEQANNIYQNSLYIEDQSEESLTQMGKYFWKTEKNLPQANTYLKRSFLKNPNSISNLKRLIKLYIEWKNWKEFDDLILDNYHSRLIYEKCDQFLSNIANIYFARDYTQAINFFLKAFDANNNLREPHLKIAQIEFIKQDFKKSQEFLTLAYLPTSQINQQNEGIQYDLLYLKAQLLIQNENEIKALPLLKKCIELRPQDENSYFAISCILQKCKSKQACEYFKKGKILNQTTELGLIVEAKFLFENSLFKDCFNCLDNCIELYPSSQMCYLNMGEFNIQLQNWEAAQYSFSQCLGIKSNIHSLNSRPLSSINILDCKIELAFALKQLNREQEAYDIAISTYRENPKHFKSIKLLSELLIMRGEINESIRLCQQYLTERPDDTEVHYILANARILKKDADIAIPSLLHCKKLNPNYPEINLRLGEAYEEDDNHMSAFQSYINHLNLEPTCKKALLKYIVYCSILSSFKEAHLGLDKLLSLYPRDSDAYFAEGQLTYHEGNITNALSLIEESVRLDPLEGRKVVYLIHLYQIIGDHQKQIGIYNKLININPNNCKTLTNIGTLYLQMHKYGEAKECYIKCVTIDRYQVEHHSNLGLVYYATFEYLLALKSFENAISIKPDHINSLYSIALTLNSMGNTQQAIYAFQKCIKMHPYFIKAYISLAKLQIKLNMLQNALQTCQESLERQILNIVLKQEDACNADIATIHSLISVIYGKRKDYLNQIDELLKCLKYSPQNIKYLNSLALAYTNQQNNQKAQTIFEQLTNLDPHNITNLFNLAEIYHRIKQFPLEIQTLSKCIQLDSFFEKAYINLAFAYSSMNDIPSTISTYLQCIGIFPTNSDAYFNLGNVYSSLNTHSSNFLAITSYKKAIFLNPNHLSSLNNLALIYLKIRDYSSASICIEKCIFIDPSSKYANTKKLQIISSIQNN